MVSHETLHYKNRAVFNTIGFIIMITVNALGALLPINGKTAREVSAEYPNLFTPAAFTFEIWGLIYLAVLSFVVYQLWLSFSDKQPEMLARLMNCMKDWFLISCVANACWLFAWHYELLPVTIPLMLLLSASLLIIHIRCRIAVDAVTPPEKFFIHLPFSLYFGWVSIATISNFAALFVYAGWQDSPEAQVNWAVGMISVGTITSIIMVLLRNNIIHALVNVWAFYGILVKRKQADIPAENIIIHACIIAIGIIAVTISWQLYRKQKS
ncbi:hypothetical protein [Chitinophaga vietnamensis]|uniref:hypothetical protein n=1 Tax=Chitinophaga vietnamensis TaxID=2593957 RepID=UPI001178117A|nr:hypothetical protein [Chitinophaga vietnamensis]